MGNCLKKALTDDIDLLRGNTTPVETPTLENPPPYRITNTEQCLTAIPRTADPMMYHPTPNVSRPLHLLTEEEQIKIAKRIGMINQLPTGNLADTNKKAKECVICMIELMPGDRVRYLPCMHTYHRKCIDEWLMRSFTCPSCMEPVDAALLCSYDQSPPM